MLLGCWMRGTLSPRIQWPESGKVAFILGDLIGHKSDQVEHILRVAQSHRSLALQRCGPMFHKNTFDS
jgi:hypothetical protein